MASRKNDPNSSKTAHVMNLLSRGRGNPSASAPQNRTPDSPAPSPAPAAPAASQAVPPQAPHASESPARETPARSSPVISIMNADANASATIKDALEDALEAALEAEAPVPAQPEPVAEEPAPAQPESVAEEPTPAEPEPVAEEPAPPEPDYACCNIMELLVEESVDRYIRMFGLCDCPRCRADVVAASLTNLIPKYVVMGKNEINPRLALYRSRYSASVTAQILRACKVVMDEPRH